MARYPNPYMGDPAIGTIASNLVRAFVDKNPGQTETNRRHADLYRLQGDKLTRQLNGQRTISGVFARLQGGQGTPQDYADVAAAAADAGLDPKDVWGNNRGYVAMTAPAGDTDRVYRSVVASGIVPNQNQGVTLQSQDSIIARDDASRARVAGIAAGPAYYNANLTDKRQRDFHNDEYNFKEATRFDKTDKVSPGEAVYPNADNPNFPKGFASGSVPVPKPAPPPTPTTVQGAILDEFRRTGQMGPNDQQTMDMSRRTATPLDVSSPEIASGESAVLRRIGAATLDENGYTVIDPEFAKQYADQLRKARLAYAVAYQKSRNAADGEQAYLKELEFQDGDRWGRESGGPFITRSPRVGIMDKDGKPKQSRPPSTVRDAFDTPTPSPARAGAPQPAAPADAPPVDKLKPGVVTKFGNGQSWTIGPDGKPQRVQ